MFNFKTNNSNIYPRLNNIKNQKELLILSRLKHGDESSLQDFIFLYKRPLANAMLRMLKSREDVEELLQDLFLRVWNNRENIDPNRSYKAYIHKIAENLVLDKLRQSARDKNFVANYFCHIIEAYSHIEENIFDKETKAILNQALSHLPEQRRRVFILCKIEGRSYEEVSQLMSISTATINSHIVNANSSLKAYFAQRTDLATIVIVSLLFSGLTSF